MGDQFGGENDKKYKSGKFKRTLIEMASKPIDQQHDLLDQEFESWKGGIEQFTRSLLKDDWSQNLKVDSD